MTLMDLQILVKGYANTSSEARKFIQKVFASPHIYCHLKTLLNYL